MDELYYKLQQPSYNTDDNIVFNGTNQRQYFVTPEQGAAIINMLFLNNGSISNIMRLTLKFVIIQRPLFYGIVFFQMVTSGTII